MQDKDSRSNCIIWWKTVSIMFSQSASLWARRQSHLPTMFSRSLVLHAALSYLCVTQATSLSTVAEYETPSSSSNAQSNDGSTGGYGVSPRDGYRSVGYYVVSDTAIFVFMNQNTYKSLELGNIWSKSPSTGSACGETNSRSVCIRQHTPGNRGGVSVRPRSGHQQAFPH